MPVSSDLVRYRTLGVGDYWPATVESVRPDGRINIVLDSGLRLSRIALFGGAREDCPRGEAYREQSIAAPDNSAPMKSDRLKNDAILLAGRCAEQK